MTVMPGLSAVDLLFPSLRRYVDTEEEETTMIAMHIADLVDARTALASGAHAYSSSYTHCEV